jgi:hypothetical protein
MQNWNQRMGLDTKSLSQLLCCHWSATVVEPIESREQLMDVR